MNRVRSISVLACLVGVALPTAGAQEDGKPQQPPAAKAAAPDRADLEKQFAETMSGATLEGTFTTTGNEDKPPAREKYTLGKVKKLKDDYWLFEARIQYGDHDVTLPLTLQVKWAGDTPVITLTDVLVPGFGTFTARVMVFRGQYAGTWSGGDHGGHLFGKIVKPATDDKKAENKDKAPTTK